MPLVPIPLLNDPANMPDAWTPWALLRGFDLAPYSKEWGCYAFAIKTAVPPVHVAADPLDPDIVDIGETKGKSTSIKRRVGDFRAIVLDGLTRSHAAGWTFLEKFPNTPAEHVYVSVYTVWDGSPASSKTLTMLLERTFIHNWVVTHGRLPPCNKE